MCTLGIFFISLLGLVIPNDPAIELSKDDFLVANYWRVIWGLPIFFSILQIILMIFVFKYDTPEVYKQNADYERLTELLSKIYIQEHIPYRMDEITVANDDVIDNKKKTMYDSFFDPQIRRAAWIGCAISCFQQLSGINAIIFYSSAIFDGLPSNSLSVNT